MQLQVSSVHSFPFDGPWNEDTNLCQAKKYLLVIYAIWAFDRYVIQFDTSRFSLQKPFVFRLHRNNEHAVLKSKATVSLVSRLVECRHEFVPD